jgi:spore coat polysaccharide biosynthesis predicted glycosyltransferase SpsG
LKEIDILKLLGITIAGDAVGIGHAKRIEGLFSAAERIGIESELISFLIPKSDKQIRQSIIELQQSLIYAIDVVLVLDFDPIYLLTKSETFENFLREIAVRFPKIVLFDIDGDSSILKNFPFLTPELVVVPYGIDGRVKKGNLLHGFGFTIFSSEIMQLSKMNKAIAENPTKILVTAGGSDPYGIGLIFLDAISKISDPDFVVVVIFGPHMNDSIRNEYINTISQMNREIRIIDSPKSLAEIFADTDIALSSSGLTRNELLVCGIPTIVLNIDKNHALASEKLAKFGALINAGTQSEMDRDNLVDSVSLNLQNLINDYDLRYSLVKKSRNLISIHGADEILKEIMKIWAN